MQGFYGGKKLFQTRIIEEAWDRTRGKCMMCGKKLVWKNKGKRGSKGAWKTGPISNLSSKGYVFSNCEIDCLNCYNQTRLWTKESTYKVSNSACQWNAFSINLSFCWISFGNESSLIFLFFLELKESSNPKFAVSFDISSLPNVHFVYFTSTIAIYHIWWKIRDIAEKAFQKLKRFSHNAPFI